MEKIRLQKYFSDNGIMSRRAAEKEILAGNVKINGEVAELGSKVDPENDVIEFLGNRLEKSSAQAEKTYIMLNKPRGYVTTASDERGRKTVMELIENVGVRVYPVGRLDMDSDGLLFMTNDGELTNRLTHPKHEIPKIYEVKVSPYPSEEQLALLRSRLVLDGYQILPVKTEVILREDTSAVLKMTLFEGRNRQIRKMCDIASLKVQKLTRVAVGDIKIDGLRSGKWRYLTKDEISYLKGEQ